MSNAMEGILPKSPAQQNIVEQVTSKTPPTVVSMQTTPVTPPITSQPTPMQQNNDPQPVQSVQQTQPVHSTVPGVRKAETPSNGLMSQDLMTDHEILNYINSSCFDPQNDFLM